VDRVDFSQNIHVCATQLDVSIFNKNPFKELTEVVKNIFTQEKKN